MNRAGQVVASAGLLDLLREIRRHAPFSKTFTLSPLSRCANRPALAFVLLSAFAAIFAGRPAHAQESVLVASVEGISEYRLNNGLRVILMPDASSPRITVVTTYFVGVRHEGYGETGMSHLLEHMLLKGTADHPDIGREMGERGATFDATTWYDRTNYYETLPATEDNLSWALGLEADRMLNARISEEELRSERTVVLNELDYYKGLPLGSIRGRVQATAYHWHNYGKSVGGERSDLENVPVERLRGFYRRHYQPDNAALLVAGRFDEGRVLDLVQEKFGGIPRPVRTGDLRLWSTYTREPPQEGEREVNLRRAGDQQVIVALHHMPPASHPDFAAVDLLAYILGNAPSGRLYRNLVATNLAAEVGAETRHFRDAAPLFAHATVPPDGDLAAAEQALKRTLSAVVSEEPVTGDEVERARTARLRQMQREFNDTEPFARSLSQWMAAGDWRLFFVHRDRIEQVTAADVNRVARAYLKPANRTLGRFIPTTIPDRTEIPAAPDVEALVHQYQGRQVVASGEAFDPSPGNVDTRTSVFTLPNGFTVALLPKSTRGRTVQGRLRLHLGDEQSLWGRAIAGAMTTGMLMSGTEDMSGQNLRDTLDRFQADVRVDRQPVYVWWDSDRHWFDLIDPPGRVTVTIEATAETLADVVRLVAELVRRPGFNPGEFEILKQQQIAALQTRRSDPMEQARIALGRHIEPRELGHPHYRYTLDEAVAATDAGTLDQVKAFHRDFYGPQKGSLVLVGDFDAVELREALEEAFGAWESPRSYTPIIPESHDVPGSNLVIETPDQANAYFFAWQNVDLRESDPDYPALVLAAWMLGHGELTSRLGRRLRVEEGLSSALRARVAAQPVHPGHFVFTAMHAPGNADRIEASFRDEFRKVLEEGFHADELEAAKHSWLADRQLSRSEDRVLADLISSNLDFDRDMGWHAELEQKVRALTPARVNAATRAHLSLEEMTFLRAGDFATAKP